MFIISLIIGLISIGIVNKGEEENHYLYSLYVAIFLFINLFINLPSLFSGNYENSFEIIKDQPFNAIISLIFAFIIMYISNLIAYKFSSNTTRSKFTFFIKFKVIQYFFLILLIYFSNLIINS